ncbi:MAG: protein TolR [Chromatiales bacterium]
MAARHRRKKLMSDINVVPYIDVMLVLLIIFMITAPLVTQGVKIELPKTEAQEIPPADKEPFIIDVDAKGDYFINFGEGKDRPVSLDTVATRVLAVKKYQPDIVVLVRGDTNVPYGRVVELMGYLSTAGVTNVGLITEPLPAP